MPIKTALTIGLSVIPPANRRSGAGMRPNRLSTRSPARAATDESGFRPQVVAPDEQVQRQRKVFQNALRQKAQQLEDLIAAAVDVQEVNLWREELVRLTQP